MPGLRSPGPSDRTSAFSTVRRERIAIQRPRLFVALDLPAAKKSVVESWGSEALVDPALRPIPEENLRITLLFLGNRPERQVPRLLSAMRDLCEGMSSPSLALCGPVQRPKGGRPRLYALPATSPSAEVLHIGLRELLSDRCLHERDDARPFWPHVAVARVRPELRGKRRRMTVERAPAGHLPRSLTQPFWAPAVGLYRSDLHSEGVRHFLLGKVDFTEPD